MIEQQNENSLIVKDRQPVTNLKHGEHHVTSLTMFHVFNGRLQVLQTNDFSAKYKRQQSTAGLLTLEETIALRDLLNAATATSE